MRSDLVVFDAAEGGFLGASWRFYAATFPGSVGVTSWREFCDVLERNPSRNVQLWGHGRTGAPLIAGAAPPDDVPWFRCRSVWFRSCSVANRDRGRAFMARVAEECDVAAHLGIVGTWGVQSRLEGVRMLRRPDWGDDVDPRENSAPWLPRTVLVTARTLPSWAFRPEGVT